MWGLLSPVPGLPQQKAQSRLVAMETAAMTQAGGKPQLAGFICSPLPAPHPETVAWLSGGWGHVMG